MSSAFLDTGAPIQNPNPDGQISHPLFSHFSESYLNSNPEAEPTRQPKNRFANAMKPSNFGDLNSGFSSSRASGGNVSFTSPSVSRTGARALSKPRLAKLRKQSGSQNSKPLGEAGDERGFNPFRTVLGPAESISSVSGEPGSGIGENEPFVFEASRNDLGDKRISERMKILRIGSDNEVLNGNLNVSSMKGFVFGRDHSKSSLIDVGLEKLIIDDSEQFADGKSKLSANSEAKFGLRSGGNADDTSAGKSVDSCLSNELKKKLNVAKNGDSDNGSGGKGTFAASERKMFGRKNDGMGHDAFAESSENLLPDRIKNLSIKDQVDAKNAGRKTSEEGSDVYGGNERAMGYGGGERETLLSNEMGHKIDLESMAGEPSRQVDALFSSSKLFEKDMQTGKKGAMKGPVFADAVLTELIFSGSQGTMGQSKVDTQTDLSSGGLAGGVAFGAPFTRRPEKPDMVSFTSSQDNVQSPFVEFKTSNQSGSLFSSQKPEFGAKSKDSKVKKKRGKLKQPTKVHLWPGQDFVSNASVSQEAPEVSESYSPMDISPYQVTASESQLSRETAVTSEELFSHDNQYASAGSQQTVMSDAIDEDLAAMTQRMAINGEDVLCGETEQDSSKHFAEKITSADSHPEDSISGAETESFKSANEELDFINEGAVTTPENEACSSTNIEMPDSGIRTQFFSAASSEHIGVSGFTFAASPGQALPKRYQKKKDSRAKITHDSYSSTQNVKFSDASSSLQFSPLSTSSLPLAPEDGKKVDNSPGTVADNSEILGQGNRQESFSTSAASATAQEACEKWRLRGNQAYKNGDLSKAEECYTQGLNCVSRRETSRSCLRALMLCYSNRAATLMSLGRMRDALGDCQAAADIDPNFLRVQVRAANCHLALGEVEHALQYFSKCLQLGTDVCVDRKIAVEASEGLQKAQKVSKFMQYSAELLQMKTSDDAVRALEVIVEALSISPYSEKLLEMKTNSLFMLRKYEDVIQLCEQTLDSAKNNSPSAHANCQLVDLDDSELAKNSSFRLWRYCLIVKSYFYLGKLEEAIGSLEKQDKLDTKSLTTNGGKTLESSIPLAATVKELLHYKTTGNEAFQAGRHSEAIEHYSAALSRNVESRPFAAICFCNRAAAYKALGQITDAIADCSLAIALDGNYLKAISRRATLYEMIRDYGQAATDLRRLAAVLTKQVEEKANQSGMSSDRSTNLANDLRQARQRLSTIEEASRNDIPLDMYLILGIESSASAAEIKKAYRKAALRHHPDKAGQALARSENADDGLWKEIGEEVHKDADRLFKMIGEAYAVLSDPTKRSQYDLEDEMRNALKKRNGSSTYRTHMEAQNYPFERTGSRRQWREVWRSYGR